ncbi:MAG: glycosyltransferase family 39 protein [Bacteroidia bacterium]|nr:glycosyltransferase family 39 protein [Bacteroidia bacterium]
MNIGNLQQSDRTPFLLVVILGVAAYLRLHGLTGFSLSNDELSAITRLRFDNLKDVVLFGVYPDFHPAGVQVFLYYWTKLLGTSEFIIRLPFALAGVGTVYLLYRTGKIWFNQSTALLAAASLAVLEYPVLYSQIARPYSSGLFFSMLAIFCWSAFFKTASASPENKKLTYGYLAGFIVAVSACMYNHYFSFITAGLYCLAGLFFVRKQTLVPYLLAGVAIVLLYLPHYNLFIHQLAKGGVGGADGWLGPPKSDAFVKYLEFVFNDSRQLLILFSMIMSGTILLYKKEIRVTKYHFLALFFFLTPFAIAYFYSIYKNPVFQHSVLLFSFPFLLLFIFSFIPNNTKGLTAAFLTVVILTGGAYSTVKEKKYYSTPHFSEFRGIAKRIQELDVKYDPATMDKVVNVFHPYYLQYYLDILKHPTDFKINSVMNDSEVKSLNRLVTESRKNYLLFAFSNTYDDPAIDALIRTQFPFIIEQDSFFNSGLRLYSKDKNGMVWNALPDAVLSYGFETGEWSDELKFRDSSSVAAGKYAIKIDSGNEFGPGLFRSVSELKLSPGSSVDISIKGMSPESVSGAKLVVSIEKNNETLSWQASDFDRYLSEPGKWSTVVMHFDLPTNLKGDETIKIYCWNEKRKVIYFDDFKMNIYFPR